MTPSADKEELKSRLQIKLSCAELSQLAAELHGMHQYLRPGAMENPDKISILGVAFVPDSDEYICELRLSLRRAERERINAI